MNYKVRLTTLLDALFVIVVCTISYGLMQTNLGDDISPWVGRIGLLVIIWCAITDHRENNKWFTFIFMFEASFYVFTLGQSFLCGLGLEIGTVNQYKREPVADVNTAYIFSILCLMFMHLGILAYLHKPIRERVDDQMDYSNSMKTIGLGILPFAFVTAMIELYQLFVAYRASGYAAAYASLSGTTSWAKIPSLIADYFPYVLFLLLIAYKDDKTMKKVFAGGIIGLTLANFAIGNRSEPICYIVALMWIGLENAENRHERKRKMLLSGVVVLVLMLVIPIIGQTRNSGGLSISGIIDGLTGENSALDLICETISSLGYSVFPTIKTMQLIPECYPFHYGQSYLFAILGIFPNIFSGTHIAVQYAALAQWLMKVLNMTYGPGYSTPAEAFYNFGWYGILFMPIIGIGVSRLLDERNAKTNELRTFMIVGCFIVLFSVPRRDTLTALRELVFYVGAVALAAKMLVKRAAK